MGLAQPGRPRRRLDGLIDAFARRVASLPDGVLEAVVTAVDTTSIPDVLTTANDLLGQLFVQLASIVRTRALLAAVAQIREGERHLEELVAQLDAL